MGCGLCGDILWSLFHELFGSLQCSMCCALHLNMCGALQCSMFFVVFFVHFKLVCVVGWMFYFNVVFFGSAWCPLMYTVGCTSI